MEKQVHEKVRAFIEKHKLISPGDELVLGVSGGADSMMLLHYFYLHQSLYNVKLKVAHIHHGLRQAADLDAQLVEESCQKYKIPFYRHDCNISEISKAKKLSEEETGRLERYNFFISLLNPNGKIVTAHNMNDQAETMLMRFARGTDVKGLAGILPRREQIIRPILCLTREEIEAYCMALQIPYRDDESNFKEIYTRNKIRLKCLPYIKEELNPSIISVLGRQSELYREEEDFLELHTKELYEKACEVSENQILIKLKAMENMHRYMQKRVILKAIEEMVGRRDITTNHITSCVELMELQVGREIHLPYGLVVKKDYEELRLTKESRRNKEENTSFCLDLKEGIYHIPKAELTIEVRKCVYERINQNNENIYTKYIDYGKIKNGLQIRTRRASDYIKLKGGSKKLKKLFTDDKISKAIRDTLPLIADGDEIVWIVGNRLNIDYYITEQTDEILEIKILKERN
ncbi:MAG: tRNA lysidine(34) synthetase TilS [Cellulosilyticum sp.]|nr:tRNA lysidine(34) synthetase TilS [Cellulosilyticum sp.]